MILMADLLRKAGLVTEDEAAVAKVLVEDTKALEERIAFYEKHPPKTDTTRTAFEEAKAQLRVLRRMRVKE